MTPPSAADRVHYIWQNPGLLKQFSTAVSLHSHTQHSKELLGFIPRYSSRLPVLSQLVRYQENRYRRLNGTPLDFNRGWWTPPLSAREAYALEADQIEKTLGLRALVSLTDHDELEACARLQVIPHLKDVPLSTEWTVPYGESFFHLGVHNLPPRWAPQVMERLGDFTDNPREADLPELLDTLNRFASTLIVFNHPLWDEPGIGHAAHRALLLRFLTRYKPYLHALELNGLRSLAENAAVARLATEWQLPVISGGDRHGREPNANLNLTSSTSFAEFVSEVRNHRRSEVVFLSQYREPVNFRLLQGLLDVVRDYPDLPEDRRRWTDRVFFRCDDGTVKRLSELWQGDGPGMVRVFIAAVRLLEHNRVQGALRLALAGRQEVST